MGRGVPTGVSATLIMTFSYFEASKSYYMQVGRDVRYTKDSIDDDFDEANFEDDNQFDTNEGSEEQGIQSHDDDSAPFDFDEEDVEQEEPDYDDTGSSETDDVIGGEVEEEQSDDESNSQDPDEIDQHDEVDVQQETDVKREIEQEDDIDQTEETFISEPTVYPDDDDYDTDDMDEADEDLFPDDQLDPDEDSLAVENFPGQELQDAFEFANQVLDEAPTELDFLGEEVMDAPDVESFYEPEEGAFQFDTLSLDINDPSDDVFANLMPGSDLGDPNFKLFDNDLLDLI